MDALDDVKAGFESLDADDEIDSREVAIEEECLKILALHQPVAADLRFVIAVMKVNNDLERMGDQAVNIAERVDVIAKRDLSDFFFDYSIMGEKAEKMLKMSLDALVNMDYDLAMAKLSLAGIAMQKRRKREATTLLQEAKKLDKHNMLAEQLKMMQQQMKKGGTIDAGKCPIDCDAIHCLLCCLLLIDRDAVVGGRYPLHAGNRRHPLPTN